MTHTYHQSGFRITDEIRKAKIVTNDKAVYEVASRIKTSEDLKAYQDKHETELRYEPGVTSKLQECLYLIYWYFHNYYDEVEVVYQEEL